MVRHETPSGLPFAGESATLGQASGRLTLVSGSTFMISALSGDIEPTLPHGLFFEDVRVLSMFRLTIDGHRPEVLSTIPDGLNYATIVSRVPIERESLLVFRRRTLSPGLHQLLELRSSSDAEIDVELRLRFGADYAHLFDVKDGHVPHAPAIEIRARESGVVIELTGGSVHTEVRVDVPFRLDGNELAIDAAVPPRGSWTANFDVEAEVHSRRLLVRTEADMSARRDSLSRAERWCATRPTITTDNHHLAMAYQRSLRDLASLRLHDDRYGEEAVVAAGAPWFMTLFGRDSLITSWMALPVDASLAMSTLRVLAKFQGRRVNDETEEQPGRILHEVRHGSSAFIGPGGGEVYYGSADATPLFVALAGEVARWGAGREQMAPLMPHVDAALAWIDDWGDSDHDGYVEYDRRNPRGLLNQGWKDSWDAISFTDGRLAEPPIALCEVQGYVYAAFRARAVLAELFGEAEKVEHWTARADALRRRFDADFWLPEHGWYALALDGEKRPVDALASNVGHLLWTGIADPARCSRLAELLLSADMFSGWGVRTLSRVMPRYDPLAYHNGSVWPHDTAIAAAGLMRYGQTHAGQTLANAIIGASEHFDGHLPELFTGLSRAEAAAPVDYPSSSVPQAWAAASPLLLVRALLGLEPDLVRAEVAMTPALPLGTRELGLDRMVIDRIRHVHVRAAGELCSIDGLPDHVAVARARPWAT